MNLPDNFGIAITITMFAGLATTIGGCVAFAVKPDNLKILSLGLGFSAGVMVFLSFMDILPEACKMLAVNYPNSYDWLVYGGFIVGIAIAALIDYFIPDHIDQQQLFDCKEPMCRHRNHAVKRAGLFTAAAICVHNFPEGMATFLASSQNLALGISVGIAIAIHNIPEGIAVALPIYNATGKKRYAMLYSSLSGLSEPLGALIGIFLFQLFMPQILIGFLFAAVAGIMVYISFDTLLPLAREYGNGHLSMIGIVSGMLFMWMMMILLG
ncbi:MAG: zinc transporter ZupT [Heliobacteriaceae bacterium]|jgi:ZIP family zinc transporter|nr:zinc transporter ZupT [Heliobacteriaceae bacterium]